MRPASPTGAALYESQGEYAEAEPLYEQAIEIDRACLPPKHPQLASHLNNLGRLYEDQERYSEAEPLIRQALEILESVLPRDHQNVVKVRGNLEQLQQLLQK